MDIRERILQAAAAVYAKTGFRGATTRLIAHEAGVNEITLFRHFGCKSKLLHEAIECSGMDCLLSTLPETPVDPRSELLEWCHAHLESMRAKRALIRTWMGEIKAHPEMRPSAGGPVAQSARQLQSYLRRLSAMGLATAEFEPIAASNALLGMLFSDAMARDIMPDVFSTAPDAALLEYVDLFLRAIGLTTP